MTPLITVAQVIELNAIHKKIDEVLIENEIIFAQERYIKDALGEKLYDEIVSQFEGTGDSDSDTEALSTANQTLLDDHLTRMLASYTLYCALPQIHLAIGSQGVMENFTTYSAQTSKSSVAYLRDSILNKADFYRDEMVKFIFNHATDYPLYFQSPNNNPKRKRTSFIIH